MITNNQPSPYAWLAAMDEMWHEGECTPVKTYHGEPLVNLGGVVLATRETAAALTQEAA